MKIFVYSIYCSLDFKYNTTNFKQVLTCPCSHRLMVRTTPSQGVNTGSNPVGNAKHFLLNIISHIVYVK